MPVPRSPLMLELQSTETATVMSFSKFMAIPSATARELVSTTRIIAMAATDLPFTDELCDAMIVTEKLPLLQQVAFLYT